ncbi:unnamed protein product [Effrenium voratum]|nr:unnamed protein product [Effrenium voratum]
MQQQKRNTTLYSTVKLREDQVGHCRAAGNAQLGAGEALAALESYSNGIELCAKHSITGKLLGQLYVNRAQAQARLERHDLALQDCRAGLQEDPGNGRGYWRGASSALKLRQGDEAARLCMRGIKVLGDSASLESLLEEAKAQIEKDKTAIVEEEKETEVSVGQALADRAASLLLAFRQDPSRADDLRRAVKLFEASLQEEPTNESALIGLGEILDEGLGDVPQDQDAAKRLWLQAVTAGSQRAQMKLCLQGLQLFAVAARKAAGTGG